MSGDRAETTYSVESLKQMADAMRKIASQIDEIAKDLQESGNSGATFKHGKSWFRGLGSIDAWCGEARSAVNLLMFQKAHPDETSQPARTTDKSLTENAKRITDESKRIVDGQSKR